MAKHIGRRNPVALLSAAALPLPALVQSSSYWRSRSVNVVISFAQAAPP